MLNDISRIGRISSSINMWQSCGRKQIYYDFVFSPKHSSTATELADVRSRHNNNVCDLAARDCLRKAMMPEKKLFFYYYYSLLLLSAASASPNNKQNSPTNFFLSLSRRRLLWSEKCFSTNTLGDADKPPPTINCQFIWPRDEVLSSRFKCKVVVTDFHPSKTYYYARNLLLRSGPATECRKKEATFHSISSSNEHYFRHFRKLISVRSGIDRSSTIRRASDREREKLNKLSFG